MKELIVVGVGGFLGAVARYWMSGTVYRWWGTGFPWGTLAVNLFGCLLLGALMGWVEARPAISPELKLFLGIGILGSFITFSALSFETLDLLRRSAWVAALSNTVGSLLLGLIAVVAGRELARWVSG